MNNMDQEQIQSFVTKLMDTKLKEKDEEVNKKLK